MNFIVKVHNKFLCEAIQKLAFLYNFSWNGIQKVNYLKADYLYFDDGHKEMTYSDEAWYLLREQETKTFDAKKDWDLIEKALMENKALIFSNETINFK